MKPKTPLRSCNGSHLFLGHSLSMSDTHPSFLLPQPVLLLLRQQVGDGLRQPAIVSQLLLLRLLFPFILKCFAIILAKTKMATTTPQVRRLSLNYLVITLKMETGSTLRCLGNWSAWPGASWSQPNGLAPERPASGWSSRERGSPLRWLRSPACGTFSTAEGKVEENRQINLMLECDITPQIFFQVLASLVASLVLLCSGQHS